jgi:hypothetical protein
VAEGIPKMLSPHDVIGSLAQELKKWVLEGGSGKVSQGVE